MPIRVAGSWEYLAGSRRESTSHFIVILIDIRENETIMFETKSYSLIEKSWYQNYN